jgi:hypothetical protein
MAQFFDGCHEIQGDFGSDRIGYGRQRVQLSNEQRY